MIRRAAGRVGGHAEADQTVAEADQIADEPPALNTDELPLYDDSGQLQPKPTIMQVLDTNAFSIYLAANVCVSRAQEMIAMHPIEYATVSSRVIAIGGSFTILLVSHCAYLLLRSLRNEPRGLQTLVLQFLCSTRLLAAIPRPYVWLRFFRLHTVALRQTTALRIAQHCLAAVSSS